MERDNRGKGDDMEQNQDNEVEKPYWTIPKKLLALFLWVAFLISGTMLAVQAYRDYQNRSIWVVEADGIKIRPGETKAQKLQKAGYVIVDEGSGWNQQVKTDSYTVVSVKKADEKTPGMRVIFANPSSRTKKVKDCEIWAVSLENHALEQSGIRELLIEGKPWKELSLEQLIAAYGEPELWDERQIGGRTLKNYRWIDGYNGMNVSVFEDEELLSLSSWHAIPYVPMAVEVDSDSAAETEAENRALKTTASQTGAQLQTNSSQSVIETAPGSISLETAKSIAMNDAGVSGEAATHSVAKLDWEDGRQVYEIDFFLNGVEYEYEILASDGSILKKKQDSKWGKNSGAPTGSIPGQETAGPLTMEQARQKVAERIPGVDAANIYMKEDHDDGRLQYEGKVYDNQIQYEFELDAETGMFLEWKEEAK